MKNANLKKALMEMRRSGLQTMEGEVVSKIRGGVLAPCSTKCGTNTACNSNGEGNN
ncbi:MAG: hypothetical protein WBB45_07805 [Cyclobacteriaceae bacterium]